MEKEAGPGDISSFTLQWKEKPNSWTWSIISAPNNDAVLPGTPRGSACLLMAALTWKLSNTKQKALNQPATVAEFWSRTMSFVCLEASGVGWARCCYQHGFSSMKTWGILRFLQYSRRPLTHCSHVPGGWAAHTKGYQVENMASEKRVLKTLYWQCFTSLLQTSSSVWCCPLLLIPAGGTMPEFGWLSPFFFWIYWIIFVAWYVAPFPLCLPESGWIVWLLLAHIQALSSYRTQAVTHGRRLGNVTFCLCQGMGMSSEIQKLPWTFLPSLVLFTTWVYLGHREMNQNWLGLYLAL